MSTDSRTSVRSLTAPTHSPRTRRNVLHCSSTASSSNRDWEPRSMTLALRTCQHLRLDLNVPSGATHTCTHMVSLCQAEQFLCHLAQLPRLVPRLRCMQVSQHNRRHTNGYAQGDNTFSSGTGTTLRKKNCRSKCPYLARWSECFE